VRPVLSAIFRVTLVAAFVTYSDLRGN